jgi:hypothetical protein
MDTNNQQNAPSQNGSSETASDSSNIFQVFNIQNALIIILLVLLIFSLLGINLLSSVGYVFESGVNIIKPFILQILSIFGYTTGSLINTTADAVGDTTKAGIDIAEGTLHSVGDLLIDSSKANTPSDLANTIQFSPIKLNQKDPKPDNSHNSIQNSIACAKNQWCLVGEYENKRGCVEVGKDDKCMSGQVFPSQMTCMNPTMTQNMPNQQHPRHPQQPQQPQQIQQQLQQQQIQQQLQQQQIQQQLQQQAQLQQQLQQQAQLQQAQQQAQQQQVQQQQQPQK